MLKKVVIIVLVLAALLSIVMLGKGLLTGFKQSEITLTYWGLWEDENTIKPILDDYQKSHTNIKINYVKQNKIQYRERLAAALAKEDGPDLFRFHNTWLPMFKGQLAELPSNIMTATEFNNTFYPIAFTNLSSGGKIYGLPLEVDTLALFYNEDLFQKAGVTPPTTWEELRKTANQLTVRDEDGRIKIAGVALGTTGNVEHFSDILGLMFLQNGTDMTKVASTIGSDGHNLGEDTIKFYTNFTIVDKVWDETMDNSTLAFATGKVAMYFGPSWEVFEIKKLSENQQVNVPFKVVPVPQLPRKNLSWASYWAEGVSINSKHQKEAWQFLQYLSTKEVMQKFYTLASNKRNFGEPFSRKDLADSVKNDLLVNPFIEQANNATSWYLASRTYDNGLNDKTIKYFEDAVNSIVQGEEAIKSLKTVEQGVTQVLSPYAQ